MYDDRKEQSGLAILTHVLGLLTGFIGPLIIFLIVDDSKPFAKSHAKEALNFQITITIALALSACLTLIVIGFLGLIAFGLIDLIFSIVAAVKASNLEDYQYPVTIRFIK